jgi:hypothetical protein
LSVIGTAYKTVPPPVAPALPPKTAKDKIGTPRTAAANVKPTRFSREVNLQILNLIHPSLQTHKNEQALNFLPTPKTITKTSNKQ